MQIKISNSEPLIYLSCSPNEIWKVNIVFTPFLIFCFLLFIFFCLRVFALTETIQYNMKMKPFQYDAWYQALISLYKICNSLNNFWFITLNWIIFIYIYCKGTVIFWNGYSSSKGNDWGTAVTVTITISLTLKLDM